MNKIAIFSVPRSGSSWLGSIFDSHPNVAYRFQPLFSYAYKAQLSNHSSTTEIDRFYLNILHTKDSFVLQNEAKSEGLVPIFSKQHISHIAFKEVRYLNIIENLLEKHFKIKIIGLIRNPLATINSWLLAPKEFKTHLGWNELEEWQLASKKNLNKPEEFNGYEKWKEAALMFHKLEEKHPEQFKVVVYSNLLKNIKKEVKDIFTFCDLNYPNETNEFICENGMKNLESAYSVFNSKNVDNKWKKSLHGSIINSITNDLKGTFLEKYILE